MLTGTRFQKTRTLKQAMSSPNENTLRRAIYSSGLSSSYTFKIKQKCGIYNFACTDKT